MGSGMGSTSALWLGLDEGLGAGMSIALGLCVELGLGKGMCGVRAFAYPNHHPQTPLLVPPLPQESFPAIGRHLKKHNSATQLPWHFAPLTFSVSVPNQLSVSLHL